MDIKKNVETMFGVGAHFGLGKSRRHPSQTPYIFGTKNGTDIFDLEKACTLMDKALAFIYNAGKEGKTILFVGGKKEASILVKNIAEQNSMPYVNGRWIGGTISNFPQIRKRIDLYEKLVSDKEKGEQAKYTKRERMLIDKDIASLEKMFYGLITMKKIPDIVFIVDPRKEKSALKEASDFNIPVIALCGSDCDISNISYPIVGNDSSKSSIQYFLEEISKTFQEGKKAKV